MSIQMDACFKKERVGTLFIWVGALEGGFGGGGVPQGCPPQKVDVSSKNKQPPDCADIFFSTTQQAERQNKSCKFLAY